MGCVLSLYMSLSLSSSVSHSWAWLLLLLYHSKHAILKLEALAWGREEGCLGGGGG